MPPKALHLDSPTDSRRPHSVKLANLSQRTSQPLLAKAVWSCLLLAFPAIFLAGSASAELLLINSGSLTVNFSANALATATDFPLNGQGPLMVLGRHYTAAEALGRRLTSGNTLDGNIPQIRALVDVGIPPAQNWTTDYRLISVQPGYVPASTTGLQYSIYNTAPTGQGALRFPQSSNFQIDTNGNPATATGQIGIGGADSFYFGNNDFLIANAPGTNINLGDYSVYFDASRVTGTTSGWVFSNHLGVAGGAVAFDTFGTSLSVTPTSLSLTGNLIVASDLTAFSGLRAGANVGTFSLMGATAVPEPTSMLLVSAMGLGVALRRRRCVAS